MAIDENGEWDGICACRKVFMDGVPCKFGATHFVPFFKLRGYQTTKDGIYLCGIYTTDKLGKIEIDE